VQPHEMSLHWVRKSPMSSEGVPNHISAVSRLCRPQAVSPLPSRMHVPSKCAGQAPLPNVDLLVFAALPFLLNAPSRSSSTASGSRSPAGSQPNASDLVDLPFAGLVFPHENNSSSSSSDPCVNPGNSAYEVDPSLGIVTSESIINPPVGTHAAATSQISPIVSVSAPSHQSIGDAGIWERPLPTPRRVTDSDVRLETANPLGLLAQATSEVDDLRKFRFNRTDNPRPFRV
jgi:hypothetical protein